MLTSINLIFFILTSKFSHFSLIKITFSQIFTLLLITWSGQYISVFKFKKYLHQLLFFLFMLPHNTRCRCRTSPSSHTSHLLLTIQLTEHHVQPWLHEPPRTLVDMFFLQPLQICLILLLQHFDDSLLVQWCQLFHAYYCYLGWDA